MPWTQTDLWVGEFGEGLDTIAAELPLVWSQPGPGQRFVPIEPADPGGLTPEALWVRGTRAWLGQHGEAAARFASDGTQDQRTVLRHTCELALGPGAFAAAARLLERLPPEQPR